MMLGLPRALGRVRASPLGWPARRSVAAVAAMPGQRSHAAPRRQPSAAPLSGLPQTFPGRCSVGAAPRRVAPLSSLPKTFDVEGRARALGVPLSPEECDEVRGDVKRATPAESRAAYAAAVEAAGRAGDERDFLGSYIVNTGARTPGQRLLEVLDFGSTALFAVIGAQCAGVAGMNVVGACLVGCVAATGGGTVNNLLTGAARGGVFWLRDPRFLAVALLASAATFYFWPRWEEAAARARFSELLDAAGAAPGATSLSFDEFEAALARRPALGARIAAAVEPHLDARVRDACGAAPALRPALIFEYLNRDGTAWLHEPELRVVARLQVLDGSLLYGLETVALGAVAVIGAQAGITRGLPPLACVATGVTICAGGIFRDVLCRRDIAIGGQSYALATAIGASVYVGLRQLVVAGHRVPLLARTAVAFSATVAQRAHVAVHGADDVLATWPRPDDAAPGDLGDARCVPRRGGGAAPGG